MEGSIRGRQELLRTHRTGGGVGGVGDEVGGVGDGVGGVGGVGGVFGEVGVGGEVGIVVDVGVAVRGLCWGWCRQTLIGQHKATQ